MEHGGNIEALWQIGAVGSSSLASRPHGVRAPADAEQSFRLKASSRSD
jgi:hypothetical protein